VPLSSVLICSFLTLWALAIIIGLVLQAWNRWTYKSWHERKQSEEVAAQTAQAAQAQVREEDLD